MKPGPIVTVSRSMPPDVGGYQRQMSLVLPSIQRSMGRRVFWIGGVRDREGADRADLEIDRCVRIPAYALPRRIRGVADLVIVAVSAAMIVASTVTGRRGTLLLLSPTMLLGRCVVGLASHLRWRVIVRYPTSGDLTTARGKSIGVVHGVVAVAPSRAQTTEQSQFEVIQIPNCVELRTAPSHPLPADSGRFLFVGRLITRKRPDLVMRAWAEIADRLPGWELHMIGSGGDEVDSMDEELHRFLGDRAVPRCHLSGRVSLAHRCFRSSDVLVFPSVREGLPNSVLEAMAAGTPVVAAEAEATEWFGYAPPLLEWDGDPEHLAEAMLVAANDPQRRHLVACRAQEMVRERYRPETAALAYSDLIDGGWPPSRSLKSARR